MRIPSLPLVLCQIGLGAVALADTTTGDHPVSEVDFIIPQPDVTYELGPDRRFPIVVAIQNATLWNFNNWDWQLTNYTLANSPDQTLFIDDFFISGNGSDQQYLQYDAILAPSGTYHFSWNVGRTICAEAGEISHGFTFKTGPGGQKANFSSAVTSDCSKRPSLLYQIWYDNQYDCGRVAEKDFDDDPAPCDLKMTPDTIASISKKLDDQFNKRCGDKYPDERCANYKKSAATSLNAGMWLLSLPLMALFL